MPSITSWMRLEPRSRSVDMNTGLQARIYDPLWLLARQWQVGEFQGEDNASPASATWQGECARLTRYLPGPLGDKATADGRSFDGNSIPLETLVECEPIRPSVNPLERLRFAAEAGQHFLRLLDQQSTSQSYRELFKKKFAFTPLNDDERAELDGASRSFIDLMGPRLPDGRKLYGSLNKALNPPPPARGALPSDLGIAHGDLAEVQIAAEQWLQWYETLITEPPAGDSTWMPERMEYGFSVAARTDAGEKVLTAAEYFSGQTDWYDFNVNQGASLRAANDAPGTAVTRTVIPAPITYRGMPSPRLWEFEDSQVDFGNVNAGPEDLAKMLLVEFAISYGNDWFVLPIDLPVGSLSRAHSLIVTNTFGERFVIRSANEAGEPYASWRMFQLSATPQVGETVTVPDSNLFLLSPAVVKNLESRPVEEVLFLRDEMANMAWGVERTIESATEQPLNRFEQKIPTPPPNGTHDKPLYRLATEVPDYWIPLLPVQTDSGLRLRRGAVLKIDTPAEPVVARGRILNPERAAANGLQIFEEEIPREGVRVTRSYQLTRWQDGSTHLWIGRRKAIGRGEGSSGLRFDTREEQQTG
jgi:hypothetical protein